MRNDRTNSIVLLLALAASGCATMKTETQTESAWAQREPFDSAVASVDGAGVEVELRVKRDGKISPWFSLGRFSAGSVKSEPRDGIAVEIDVLRIQPPLATAFQYRLNAPARSVKIITYRNDDRKSFASNR